MKTALIISVIILCLLSPDAVRILFVQNIESQFGTLARLFIATAIARGFDGQMQRFGHAWIGRTAFGPFDDPRTKVVRPDFESVQFSSLVGNDGLQRGAQKAGRLRRSHWRR